MLRKILSALFKGKVTPSAPFEERELTVPEAQEKLHEIMQTDNPDDEALAFNLARTINDHDRRGPSV
ncbi:MAG: hypothetical protein H6867_10425 [Rhodospirillales bacterium]|nr:hypothetical protein [Rhodospirillales bacterium]MCB9995801.1 hypothetical protein [Rhodospirillales bacterium]